MFQAFVPDIILQHLAAKHSHPDVRHAAIRSLSLSSKHRTRRRIFNGAVSFSDMGAVQTPSIRVYSAGGAEVEPGTPERIDSTTPVPDDAANKAYDDALAVFNFYQQALGRLSIDARGMPIISTVHYGQNYDNAFWDGQQMVYGDGDGVVFRPFVSVIDIPGHEMSHGVTQFTSGLNYQGQSGALNESFSDCMGSCVKQFKLGQTADKADWLIGEGIFFPSVNGKSLRDMRNPGTAYDDPRMGGRDPQPANMANYVHTSEDEGGVHVNSGIPNKAFADACVAVGGHSWEKVGLVWYKTNQSVKSSCDFATWAQTTVNVAAALVSQIGDVAAAIADAWSGVGIKVAVKSTSPVPNAPLPGPGPAPFPPRPVPGLPPLKFRQLLAYIQSLLLRVGPAALPYIEQLVASLPLNPVQKQIVDALIQSLLLLLGGNGVRGIAASDPFMGGEAVAPVTEYLCA